MRTLRDVTLVSRDGVRVGAGATWRDVLAVTLREGLAPPVLPSYLDVSVGGTIVVGGVGEASSRLGVVSDHVRDLEVVTGAGQTVRCSELEHPDAFDAVLAGLGQVAIVTSATLALAPAPVRVHLFELHYGDASAMLSDLRLLDADDRFTGVQTAFLVRPDGRWDFRIDATLPATSAGPAVPDECLRGLSDDAERREVGTVSYLQHLDRMAVLESALRGAGQWLFPHPWLTTFVGDSSVQEVVDETRTQLNPDVDLGAFGQLTASPIRTDPISTALFRVPDEPLSYAFNVFRFPTTSDPAAIGRLTEANATICRRVQQAGGTLYPVSAVEMSHADWRHHFGNLFGEFTAAKQRYDPAHRLTPGYDIFPPNPARRRDATDHTSGTPFVARGSGASHRSEP